MSYTEIFQIRPTGDVLDFYDVPNGMRGALLFWQTMANKYGIDTGFMDFTQVWKLFGNKRLTPAEHVFMGTTFDRVMVRKANVPKVIQAFREIAEQIPDSSAGDQADVLKGLPDDAIGVCWNQTSVNGDTWRSGEYDDDGDQLPYNIYRTSEDVWWLFDEIDTKPVDVPKLTRIERIIMGLLQKHRELYGLELVRESDQLKRGSVYATLNRMVNKGYLASEARKKDYESGMPKRYYRLTDQGAHILNNQS